MPVQIPVATRKYSDYILSPDLTETAVQDAIPTESYGNFGLKDGLTVKRDERSDPGSPVQVVMTGPSGRRRPPRPLILAALGIRQRAAAGNGYGLGISLA